MTQSTKPVPPKPKGMAQLPHACLEDCPSLLGHLEWAVNQGCYSPEGRLSLHSTWAPQKDPCWPPQCAPGDGENAVQARETVYWPHIDADIIDYNKKCPICTKYKASTPAQPTLPQDIPNGPWQEIAVNYFNHKDKDYLLICDLFSKFPFLYKVMSKSALSLSQKFQ